MAKRRFTLTDAKIYVNVPGETAGLELIGGVQSLTVNINWNQVVDYEAGNNLPVEIVDHQKSINVSMEQAFIDTKLFKAIFGSDFETSTVKPYFTIVARIPNTEPPKTITIKNVKFNKIEPGNMGLTGIAKWSMSGQALGIKINEEA